jgi:hypothetical protein
MDMLHAATDIFDAHLFPSDDIRRFIMYAREKKQIVIDAASHLFELPALTAYDSDTTSRKMKTQHLYSDFINRSRAKEIELLIMDHGSEADRARFLSNNGSLAGAWLFNIPKDKHSTMSSPEFRCALKLRLGADFHTLPTHCCCPQKTRVCPKAIHLFSCNEMKPFLPQRHNAIKDVVMQLARCAGFRATDSGLGRIIIIARKMAAKVTRYFSAWAVAGKILLQIIALPMLVLPRMFATLALPKALR